MDAGHDWPVIGHGHAVRRLRQGLQHGRLHHAWLITGAEGLGRATLALSFAMALNCHAEAPESRPCQVCSACRRIRNGNHPDLLQVQPEEGAALRIDAIRDALRNLALKPWEGRRRVAIFRDFERAQPRAQDALLKTLEEPAPGAVLILVATSVRALLPTISSRCQQLALRPLPFDDLYGALLQRGAPEERATLLARLSGGRVGWALRALEDAAMLEQRAEALDTLEACLDGDRAGRFALAEKLARRSRPELRLTLEQWQSLWRDLLLLARGSQVPPVNSDRGEALSRRARDLQADEIRVALVATRRLLANLRSNMQLRLALEVMLLDYPGLQNDQGSGVVTARSRFNSET
ncbi:MAG: DNA polymerase III subunit delta' [Anaerolineaceae bacterium]|nr:DNA polymerase III subunit delta' [Anaerolineaceae bacterium]MDE0328962.1 DNA polymerase III subunit delta' [Anaerolineaceae bacterium]